MENIKNNDAATQYKFKIQHQATFSQLVAMEKNIINLITCARFSKQYYVLKEYMYIYICRDKASVCLEN